MLDLEFLRRRCDAGEVFRYLYFWEAHTPVDGSISSSCLCQWYYAPFTIDGNSYPTAEHWMMASKARLFGDDEALKQILEAPNPQAAKSLGRTVQNFVEATWKQHRRRIVTEGNSAKFAQNEDLWKYLIGTEDQVLVEASPFDRIWGIGLSASSEKARHPSTWMGQNLLGFSLMDVREQIG